ncbi:MAG: hypothetical protein GX447_01785 [Elusimicrobia bacterium]|nr:hypothetical protein [Elusimicrobiota bacterium]
MSYVFLSALGSFSFFFSSFLSYYKIEPFHTLYYTFAWWSYILAADGLNGLLSQNSLIKDRTKSFLLMIPFSCGLWFLFELINIRLSNWSYQALPFDPIIRKIGYIISYATVLPAIFETKELIENLGFFKKISLKPLKSQKNILNSAVILGIIILFLILLFPKIFFPFTWIFLFLIFDPINYRIGAVSVIKQAEDGNFRHIFSVLAAGLICGIFWEMWNFNSQAKWIYSFPTGDMLPKIFEMPLHGYIGFPLFALECYSFFNFIAWLFQSHWENIPQKTHNLNRIPAYISLLLLIPLYIYTIILIDTYSVKYFIILLP